MHKKLYEIKKLLDSNKAVQAVIVEIMEVINSPISDAEKLTKIEAIVDNAAISSEAHLV